MPREHSHRGPSEHDHDPAGHSGRAQGHGDAHRRPARQDRHEHTHARHTGHDHAHTGHEHVLSSHAGYGHTDDGPADHRHGRAHHHHGHAHHHHGHSHHHAAPDRLREAFFLALAILAVEVAGGLVANSLALLSDAGHMLTDAAAVGLAWLTSAWSRRRPTKRWTYGYVRAGILSAAVNALTLLAVSAWIAYEAALRLARPEPASGPVMSLVALFALVANTAVAWRMGHGHGDLNTRSAWLHIVGDAAASAGVLLGGLVIGLTGWRWVDPAISLGIATLILFGVARLAREVVQILMEGAPPGVDVEEVAAALRELPGVREVHDLHVWNLDAERTMLTCHLVVEDASLASVNDLLRRAETLLEERFSVRHSTLQVEGAELGHSGSLLCAACFR
ncbi:MAG: cation transporter [Firmicutes bacterium]|nr:cation transporter [Bacillota bacterium]